MTDRSVLVPMTLNDLERREATSEGSHFHADLLNNARTV